MQNKTIDVRTTLLGAADLLRQRGWCRSTMQDNAGAMCMRGAIRRFIAEALPVDSDPVEYDNAIEAAENHLAREMHLGTPGKVAGWNDTICQDAATAIRNLEQAAMFGPR